MKLNQFSQNEVETIGQSVDTEFSIDTESLGVLFKGFSDALYSDKFGSIVREVTSNCFDAHEEVNQQLDVELRMIEPGFDEGKIIFQDFGPGLSPERIKNIYSKYFASTKRNTNDQIGGFGIGAKSPLAYADSFNVVTRVDGIEYNYVIHKGEQVPVISLIDQTSTDKINGTQVIIPIANQQDYNYFVNAVKAQLQYFDNICYKIPGEDFNNDYKIFRGKHWIYTTNETRNNNVEICIGKVGYPFDWSAAGFEDVLYSQQSGNFALYFDVGEISVTMNRESIEYNNKTRKAIKEKIDAFKEEAADMMMKNNVTSDLATYYDLTRERSSKLRVTDECVLYSTYFFKQVKTVYGPLEHLKRSIPKAPFFFIRVHKSIGFTDKSAGRFLKTQTLCKLLFGHKTNSRYEERQMSKYMHNTKIFRVRDRMNSMKDAYIQDTYGRFVAVKLSEGYEKELAEFFSVTKPDYVQADEYFKHMIKEVVKHTESYDDLEIPEDFIKEYKESRKKGNKIKRSAEVIPYKTMFADSDFGIAFKQSQHKVVDILKKNKMVIYGDSKQREKLINAFGLFFFGTNNRYLIKGYYENYVKDYTFIMISNQRKKFFKGHNNAVDVDQFVSKFYSKVSRIHSYSNIMDIPVALYAVDHRFKALSDKKLGLPGQLVADFCTAFKFVYNPDNEYITFSKSIDKYEKSQVSLSELQNYLIAWKEAHPMCAFVTSYSTIDKEHTAAIEHYINLINFNFKIKCYG